MDVDDLVNDAKDTETKSVKPKFIIGIGASAGGLEPLQRLFSGLSTGSNVAYVVVQHLSPDFKSVVDQILGKCTDLRIEVAKDGQQVFPDTIYLNPPRKNLLIAEGKLYLSEVPPSACPNLPIDAFFRSLAEDQQQYAIGIILSGTGSDGTRGVLAIKETGGLTIAQSPMDAQFDGMPNSAIATGVVDTIINVDDIPAKLHTYTTHPLLFNSENSFKDHLASNEEILKNIFKLLKNYNAVDFSLYKPSSIARRIERRIGLSNLYDIREYQTFLEENPHELQTLSKELLIGVTRFFRDQDYFDYLKDHVIPDILKNKHSNQTLRIWTAGVSTGEEAYSLAIVISEVLEEMKDTREVKIFATDIDSQSINYGSSARYQKSIAADISQERLKKYFVEEGDEYTVKPRIRRKVVFAVHNILKDPPFSNMDLTVCRNLLIYFQQASQKKALSFLHFALRNKGYLFLGPSESLGELSGHFSPAHKRIKIYQKNSDVRIPIASDLQPAAPGKGNSLKNVYHTPSSKTFIDKRSILDITMQTLINAYVPPSVILNENGEAIHTFGKITDYIKKIQPGKVSVTINRLIEDSIAVPVTNALHRAQREHKPILYTNVRFKTDSIEKIVNIIVRYIERPMNQDPLYVLTLEDVNELSPTPDTEEKIFYQDELTTQRIDDLESELSQSQEKQQAAMEELETTNEELQSTNEELMASNEELQSTNEELQSVNEELFTVNSEFQEKIQELLRSNSDLDNLLKSTEMATIFLDTNLTIRRYTPAATNYIRLLPMDLERPFSHLAHNLKYNHFHERISETLNNGNRFETETETVEGSPVLLRILPYQNHDNEHEGIVITIAERTQN